MDASYSFCYSDDSDWSFFSNLEEDEISLEEITSSSPASDPISPDENFFPSEDNISQTSSPDDPIKVEPLLNIDPFSQDNDSGIPLEESQSDYRSSSSNSSPFFHQRQNLPYEIVERARYLQKQGN